jgi:hypothetical protein
VVHLRTHTYIYRLTHIYTSIQSLFHCSAYHSTTPPSGSRNTHTHTHAHAPARTHARTRARAHTHAHTHTDTLYVAAIKCADILSVERMVFILEKSNSANLKIFCANGCLCHENKSNVIISHVSANWSSSSVS